jgi:TspO/MBR family.
MRVLLRTKELASVQVSSVRSRVVGAVFADGDCRVASVAVARFQKGGLGLFVAQLAANALWTWLFFAWHRGALAAVEILVLLE